MGFELGRLVREAAGELGARFSEKARELRRRAHAQADRVWRDVGEMLRIQITVALGSARHVEQSATAEPNVAVGPRTRAVVEAMAQVFRLSGYQGVRADVDGLAPPEIVHGTMRSHRPSLTAVGGGRPVLVDVFVPGESDADEQFSRWQLFASAAGQCGGEFHVVVPSRIDGSAGEQWVRRLAEATGTSVTKVWEL